VNDEVEIVGLKPTVKTICTGRGDVRKLLDEGQAGATWACCARTKREDVERVSTGQAREHHPAHAVWAEVYVLTKEEGGRHTPFFKGIAAVLLPH